MGGGGGGASVCSAGAAIPVLGLRTFCWSTVIPEDRERPRPSTAPGAATDCTAASHRVLRRRPGAAPLAIQHLPSRIRLSSTLPSQHMAGVCFSPAACADSLLLGYDTQMEGPAAALIQHSLKQFPPD